MMEWVDVAPVNDLPPGERKVISTEIGAIAVFNLGGELFAIADVCTHDGGELASGACDGDEIICPRHGARFCIKTGKVLRPPAYEDVETFTVRTKGRMIQVGVD